jgi:hypothetical protein
MKKFSLALALGAGLTLGVAAPSAVRAAATSAQTITTANMSSAEFSRLFSPSTSATQSSTVDFFNESGASGTLRSQVFVGGKSTADGIDATGLYAYAYQVSTNNVTDKNGQPIHISSAEFQFNSTPAGTTFGTGGNTVFGYTIADGKVGDLPTPASASGGAGSAPASLTWQPGSVTGSVLANFNTSSSAPLSGVDTSATFVVLSTQPPSSNLTSAGVLSALSQTSVNLVNTPTSGSISPIPIPEPTTVLAWAGMAGAVVFVRRARKARKA